MNQLYYGQRRGTKHPSKRFAFKHVCGGCGKPLRKKVGFLCKNCAPHFENMLASDRESACYTCMFELECEARVQLGIWLRCETPDIADLERLRVTGGLDNDDVRAELEIALVRSGNRKVLEEAVSKSAQALYQSYIARLTRKTPAASRIVS